MQPSQPLKMAHWREIYVELFLQNHSTYKLCTDILMSVSF